MNYALIFAGGVGTRMELHDIPKQFLKVDKKPIIIRTLEHFEKHPSIEAIVVVCLESWIDELQKELKDFHITKVVQILPGGATGFQSIHNGLEYIKKNADGEDTVLICDGVRPVLSEELISTCIADTGKYGTAVPVVPSIDSVLYSEDGKTCSKNYDRKTIYITQAPQGFKVKTICSAHDLAVEKGMEAISSADLMIDLGFEVHIFKGIRNNIKITTEEDLHSLRATHYYEQLLDFSTEIE